jgi:hypothetical protein
MERIVFLFLFFEEKDRRMMDGRWRELNFFFGGKDGRRMYQDQ